MSGRLERVVLASAVGAGLIAACGGRTSLGGGLAGDVPVDGGTRDAADGAAGGGEFCDFVLGPMSRAIPGHYVFQCEVGQQCVWGTCGDRSGFDCCPVANIRNHECLECQ